MALSINPPYIFAPAGVIPWVITSDNPNLVGFNVELFDYQSEALISSLKLRPTPSFQSGAYLDASKILSSAVRWELNNDPARVCVGMGRSVRSYALKFQERVLISGEVVDGELFETTDPYYVFNAGLGRLGAANFMVTNYLASPANKFKFLTNQPNNKKTLPGSAEFLYFLQNGLVPDLFVRVRTYRKDNSIADTKYERIIELDKYQMFRINCSIKSLKQSMNLVFDTVTRYSVDVCDGNLNPVSEERIYHVDKSECHLQYLNMLWVNQIGGIDTYTLIQPQDTISVQKQTLKTDPYTVVNGQYTDRSGGLLKPSEIIVENELLTTAKAHSRWISDEEAVWLGSVYTSKQVFIELGDYSIVPVMVQGNNYTIPKQRYNPGQPMQVSFDLQLTRGIIPSGVTAYSERLNQIDFIDEQMNTIDNSLTGHGVAIDDDRVNGYSDNDYSTSTYS
jgi:hypothetical protein